MNPDEEYHKVVSVSYKDNMETEEVDEANDDVISQFTLFFVYQ